MSFFNYFFNFIFIFDCPGSSLLLHGLSLVWASEGYSAIHRLLMVVTSLVAEHQL